VIDVVGQSTDDGKLRSNAVESKLRVEPSVVG
jgi:hypothetical protein